MVSLRVISSSDLIWFLISLSQLVLRLNFLRPSWCRRPHPDLLLCSSSETSWRLRRSKDVRLSLLENSDNRELRSRSTSRVIWSPPVNQRTTTSIMPSETLTSLRELWESRLRSCFLLTSVVDKELLNLFLIRSLSRCLRLMIRRTTSFKRNDNTLYIFIPLFLADTIWFCLSFYVTINSILFSGWIFLISNNVLYIIS